MDYTTEIEELLLWFALWDWWEEDCQLIKSQQNTDLYVFMIVTCIKSNPQNYSQ
jgi:hypothetical protein